MKLCFMIAGRMICITIPLLVWPWPWPPPNGDPWKHFADWVSEEPDPHPWRVNLPIVATLALLAQHAQGDLKGRLQEVVKAETAEIAKQLPEGATLELGAPAR